MGHSRYFDPVTLLKSTPVALTAACRRNPSTAGYHRVLDVLKKHPRCINNSPFKGLYGVILYHYGNDQLQSKRDELFQLCADDLQIS